MQDHFKFHLQTIRKEKVLNWIKLHLLCANLHLMAIREGSIMVSVFFMIWGDLSALFQSALLKTQICLKITGEKIHWKSNSHHNASATRRISAYRLKTALCITSKNEVSTLINISVKPGPQSWANSGASNIHTGKNSIGFLGETYF